MSYFPNGGQSLGKGNALIMPQGKPGLERHEKYRLAGRPPLRLIITTRLSS